MALDTAAGRDRFGGPAPCYTRHWYSSSHEVEGFQETPGRGSHDSYLLDIVEECQCPDSWYGHLHHIPVSYGTVCATLE